MYLTIKYLFKSSSLAQYIFFVPLMLRTALLRFKYRNAFAALSRFAESCNEDVVVHVPEFSGNFKISPKSNLFQRCMIYGSYEPDISRVFFENIDLEKDVIDVGANVGFYSIGSALRLKSGRVLAIEPTTGAYSKLLENIRINNLTDKVLPVKYIISDQPGLIQLNTLHGNEEYSSIGDFSHGAVLGKLAVIEEVQAVTLDSLVQKYNLRPAIIKIDVEGAEFKVLLGATETLRKYHPCIMMECSDVMLKQQKSSSQEILDFLKEIGYIVINPSAPKVSVRHPVDGDLFAYYMHQ